ncbi:MAG TPA: 2-dehydropantoate 2-reductase [Anaerolineales bacterium]|nr:2-dehydropantoate 2-reductase [Anaerolineales bacterium]
MNNILIVGTGALASLFASRLTQAGYHVTMLGTWQDGLNALREHGVRLVNADGNEQRFPVHATDDPRECMGAKYAIVLVKAWQTERAARQLVECLADDGLALTLQNGLGNYEILSQALDSLATENTEQAREKNSKNSVGSPGTARNFELPSNSSKSGRCVAARFSRVALGSTTTGATLLGPGSVRPGGEGIISLGRHQALGPLEAALKSAKFNVQVVEDPRSLIWGKLVINAAINPLTALLKVPNGELLERPSARVMLGALAREAAQVAHAESINLPFDDPVHAAEEVARKTAANHSSMLQDVLRGAPTEIDAICGAIVRAAEKHRLSTPVNWVCWQLVRSINGK